MPRHTDAGIKNDVNQPNERFLFREPIVLLTIISLSLMNGMTASLQYTQPRGSIGFILSSTIPVVGIIFIAFLSELHGRKPVFVTLFIFSIFSAILHSLPWQENWLMLGHIIQDIVTGGTLVINALAISEYCSPKHRLSYLLANTASPNTVIYLEKVFSINRGVFNNSPYMQSLQVVLGLVCLGLMWMWPESPYWLASKGRLEESKNAFLWLRGEEGRKELRSVMEERRRPGPPKLFWISFFIAFTTISISIFSRLQRPFASFYFYEIEVITDELRSVILLCSSVVIPAGIALVSYFVKRKVLFLAVCGISLASYFTVGIWLCVGPGIRYPDNNLFNMLYLGSDAFSTCGPVILALAFFTEVIPQKYNTLISCVGFTHYYFFNLIFMNYSKFIFTDYQTHYLYTPILILATLSLGGIILYFYFAPETKNKTLLEIQKLYIPEQQQQSDANANSCHDQIMMQNVL